ncbi:MAG: Ig-like domain-containing protein [Methanocellales archaeon]|nr:Ig-like domain-containing protein [Methanocellales archaeon]MDD5484879.1 Ig-like domain-containing protein [Methanocellales archaeon]
MNQTAELTCEMLIESTNTTTEIELPEGFELVSGNLTWKDGGGSVTVKAVKTGNWTVTAAAEHYVVTENGTLCHDWGSVDRVYIAVREDTAWISETPFIEIPPLPPGPVIVEPRVNITPELTPVKTPSGTIITPKPVTPPPVPSTGMEVNLSISNAPALNETAELICTITSISDAYNTTARIELPKGLVLASGNLSWNGDIIVPEEEKLKHPRPNRSDPEYDRLCEEYEYPKGRVEFSAVVKSVEIGNWTIAATAGYDVFTEECIRYGRLGDSDYVYVAVRENTAWISETLFTTEGPAPARQLNVTPPLPPVEPPSENITTPEPAKPPTPPTSSMPYSPQPKPETIIVYPGGPDFTVPLNLTYPHNQSLKPIIYYYRYGSGTLLPYPALVGDLSPTGSDIPVDTSISVQFERWIRPEVVKLEIEPYTEMSHAEREPAGIGGEKFTFYPAEPLQSETTYTVNVTFGFNRTEPLQCGEEYCAPYETITWIFTVESTIKRGEI